MGVMRMLKRTARRSAPTANVQDWGELEAELKAERVRRTVRDFPGRSATDLARIIYGRAEAELIASEWRRLEASGQVVRDTDTDRLYSARH